jgi:rare lipoprotein A
MIPGVYVELGVASWYGVPFHGRRAADGEIYDMNKMTAAHRTLPFDSVVRVTNLSNGLQTEVRIIDRGPFVGDRVIDLSAAAARALGMIGPGTAQVRIEMISGTVSLAGAFTVQVGAFSDRANAEKLKLQLELRYQPVFIQDYDAPSGHFFRVRVGNLPSEGAAEQFARKLSGEDGFRTFVIRLDDVPSKISARGDTRP